MHRTGFFNNFFGRIASNVIRYQQIYSNHMMAMTNIVYKTTEQVQALATVIDPYIEIMMIIERKTRERIEIETTRKLMVGVTTQQDGFTDGQKSKIAHMQASMLKLSNHDETAKLSHFLTRMADALSSPPSLPAIMTMMEQPALPIRALLAAEDRKRQFHEDPEKEKVPVKDPEIERVYKKLNDISSVLGKLVANKNRDPYRENRQPNRDKYSQRDDRRDDRSPDKEWRGGRGGRGGNGRGWGGRREYDDHGRREHAGIARQDTSHKRSKNQGAGGLASPDVG